MTNLPVTQPPFPRDAIAALADRHRRANGPVVRLVNRFGGKLEQQMAALPPSIRDQILRSVEKALSASYAVATQTDRFRDPGPKGRLAAAIATGAIGGAGGLASALAELPATVTLILAAIRAEARAAGFDPNDPDIRAECLRIFGSGGPLEDDDGLNTSFLSARLTLTGPAIQKVIATVAPRIATALGQKLAAQSIPILGALSGAALNATFLDYYKEVAAIRFGLLRLAQTHPEAEVLAEFKAQVAKPVVKRA